MTAEEKIYELKIKIDELQTELQQYKSFVADIKEYIKGYDVLEHFRAMIDDYGF